MTTAPLFLAVEVGTSGARAVAVDLRGRVVAEARRPYATSAPEPGWAEQDANDWSSHAVAAIAEVTSRLGTRSIEAIGLTGQCPTVVPVDEACRPLGPGLLYRDNRAVAEAAALKSSIGEAVIHARTGHSPAAFHVGSKILWIRAHQPELFARTRWFLQPRDVVLHRLTGRVATDESHANSTLFFDLCAHDWADDLLAAAGLERTVFPGVLTSWSIAGLVPPDTARELGLASCTPVVIGAGDSQCAAFGAGVTRPGAISEMAGSSSCLNGAVVRPLADVRVTHYSHVVPNMFTTEVGLNTTGAAIAWAVETLGFGTYRTFAHLAGAGRARLRDDPGDAAEAAPLFEACLGDGDRDAPERRGSLTNLSSRHDGAAIAYAVVEGVAVAVTGRCELLRAAGSNVDELRVAGGGTRLAVLGQLKADLLDIPVRHLDVDASSVGAALLAARALGHDDAVTAAIDHIVARSTVYLPDPAMRDRIARRMGRRHESWKELAVA